MIKLRLFSTDLTQNETDLENHHFYVSEEMIIAIIPCLLTVSGQKKVGFKQTEIEETKKCTVLWLKGCNEITTIAVKDSVNSVYNKLKKVNT